MQSANDLARLREAPHLLLGEDQLIAESDVEDPARAFDQVGLNAELLLDVGRQTGGSGVVVSDGAVLDRDVLGHAGNPPPRPIIGGAKKGVPVRTSSVQS